MRILLIAYEFPPSASPQSLRWTYLARELALQGNEVHVLTIDLGGDTQGLPGLPANVTIHRTHPGPFRGLVAWHRRRRQRQGRLQAEAPPAGVVPGGKLRPSWKQSVSDLLQRTAEYIWFPDLRGEWRIPGKRALRNLLSALAPQVVVSSHEPATTLELGLIAKRSGFPWVADLGDPVLAPYTPKRWRRRAFRLERDVCRQADCILVTAESALDLLNSRHGRSNAVEVLTQGFLPCMQDPGQPLDDTFDGSILELFYAGSFYRFRRPEALVRAVLDSPGVRLTIASINAPEVIRQASREHPSQIRLLGFIPHAAALSLQRCADVLVSIANAEPLQVPGKFYEYLGAARPVLHLHHSDPDDAASCLVRTLNRGEVCRNERRAIASRLAALHQAKLDGALDGMFDLEPGPVADYAWPVLADRLGGILSRVLSNHADGRR
jgi:hypothetical protein